MVYIRFQIVDRRKTKIDGVKMKIFVLKKVIGKFGLRKIVSVPPKLGAKSPPMLTAITLKDMAILDFLES